VKAFSRWLFQIKTFKRDFDMLGRGSDHLSTSILALVHGRNNCVLRNPHPALFYLGHKYRAPVPKKNGFLFLEWSHFSCGNEHQLCPSKRCIVYPGLY
jgi:hypothetical protein